VWCASRLCEEQDNTGHVVQRIYDHAIERQGTRLFLVRDHLRSVTGTTDTDGVLRASSSYDPFGRETRSTSDIDTGFGFGGRLVHRPTSLVLAPYRAYPPENGRWLSEDPLVSRAGASKLSVMPNLYRSAKNNPTTWADPSGLISWKCNVTLTTVGGGQVLAGLLANCESECSGGKKLRQTLVGGGTGPALSPLPFSTTSSDYSLQDPFGQPYEWALPGAWGYVGAGLAVIGGASYSVLQLGSAKSQVGLSPQVGWDFGTEALVGTSVAVSTEWKSCKKCQP
jgi:RHS repeat-associated protein